MSQSLATLLPNQTVIVGGVEVEVHEYTLAEQLKHRTTLKTISQGLKALFDASPDGNISLDDLYDFLGEHFDVVLQAVSIACRQPLEWVSSLSGDDSETLLMTWWGVNAPFFLREAVKPEMERLIKQAIEHLSTGAASSPASLSMGTTSTPSRTIPPAS
ncbi:DUF6631 family protein [Providencia hangzhouensis]|uniref:DUF6631 family protein n=1 Tax=Providencia hangzhouensis TaxID=3031799 RepID=UPI0030CAF930